MSVDFFVLECKTILSNRLFGLCDDPPPSSAPAYIDLIDKFKWIAVVKNPNGYEVSFIAIDNCINLKKESGHIDSSCDAMMAYEESIVFVELKECNDNKNKWIRKADAQLRNTIKHFKANHALSSYSKKVAYIANNKHPNFRSSQQVRMEKFRDEMGVRLKIQNRIELA